jgi:hypothetical protein
MDCYKFRKYVFLMKILNIIFHILNTGRKLILMFLDHETLKFKVSVTFHERRVTGQTLLNANAKIKVIERHDKFWEY